MFRMRRWIDARGKFFLAGCAIRRKAIRPMFTSQSEARVAIIVASKGRSDVLQGLVPFINRQTLKPAKLVFAVTSPADADFDLETLLDPAISGEVIISAAGACKQRNRALDRLGDDIDFCVFYDDDFYPSRHALSELVRGFGFHEDVDGITGTLVADGINGPGLSPQEAATMLSDWDTAFDPDPQAPRGSFGTHLGFTAATWPYAAVPLMVCGSMKCCRPMDGRKMSISVRDCLGAAFRSRTSRVCIWEPRQEERVAVSFLGTARS